MGGGVGVWTTDMGPQKIPFRACYVFHKRKWSSHKGCFLFHCQVAYILFSMFFDSQCMPLFPHRANKNSIRMIISIFVQCLNLKHLSLSLSLNVSFFISQRSNVFWKWLIKHYYLKKFKVGGYYLILFC